MKIIRRHLKIIVIFLAVTFSLQSCSVYTYKPTTVDNAVESGFARKIKVKTNSHDSYTFIKMERENGAIFGVDKDYGKTPLKRDQIKEIRIKKRDKTLSIVVPVLTGIGGAIGILYLIADSITIDWSKVDLGR